MKALDAVIRDLGSSSAGEVLPPLLPQLADRGVRFERGQVVMLAGPPNGGKTLLAQWYAVTARVPALYLSADTDERTMALRAAAMTTGMSVDHIRRVIDDGGSGFVADELWPLRDWLMMDADPSLSMESIDRRIRAFIAMYGETPHLIVIDSLYNLSHDDGDDWSGYRRAMGGFHTLSRKANACVMVLHHVSTNRIQHGLPGGLSSIQGQLSQHAETILTTAADPVGWALHVATVKNRHGVHDPTGATYVTAQVDYPSMRVFPDPKTFSEVVFGYGP